MGNIRQFQKGLTVMLAALIILNMLPGGILRASAASALTIKRTDGTGGYTTDSDGDINITENGSYVVSGSSTTGGVTVESGVTAAVTLAGVNINVSQTSLKSAFSVKSTASVTITLSGQNTLVGGSSCAGLFVPSGASVTITGTDSDSLTATSDDGYTNDFQRFPTDKDDGYGAGIGGSISSRDCGNVTIKGGKITAIGGNGEAHHTDSSYTASSGGSAGIGGADGFECEGGAGGTVVIEGGIVTATGGAYSAGIGGSSASSNGFSGGDGGNVTICGGTVTATGGYRGTGIGGGGGVHGGNGGNMEISGGNVTAVCGSYGYVSIGGGYGYVASDPSWGESWGGNGSAVNISGGTVNAVHICAGVSPFHHGEAGAMTVSGGSVYTEVVDSAVKDSGGNPVYKTTLALPATGVASVSLLSISQGDSPLSYGFNDMKTNGSGKLYLYLPASSSTTASLSAGGTTYNGYYGTVKTDNSGVLKMDQSTLAITGIESSYVYGNSISPSISGGNGTGKVTYTYTGTDDITSQSYSSTSAPTDVGSYSVSAQKAGDNSYYTSIVSPAGAFTITKRSLSGYILALDKYVYLYTGSEIKPGVTLKDSGGNTLDASNYSVGYTNHTAVASLGDFDLPTVTVQGKDNYTDSLSAVFTIEASPSIIVSGDTENWRTAATVTATVTVGSSGIGSVTVDDGSDSRTTLTGGILTATSPTDETSTYSYTYKVSKNGTYTFTVTDGGGYTSSQSLTFAKIDTEAPTNMKISVEDNAFTTLLNHITFGLFFDNTVDVTLSATDTDIDHYDYQIVPLSQSADVQPGSVWTSSSDGRFSISPQFMGVIFARAVDKAGNCSAIVSSAGVVIDKNAPTAPSIQAKVGTESYNSGWVPLPVTVIASNSSAFSGIDHYEYKIGESGTWAEMPSQTGLCDPISGKQLYNVLHIDTNMDDTVYVRAVSNSQIVGSESVVTVKRDDVTPVIDVSVSGITGQWTNKSVTFTLSDIAHNISPVSYQVKVGTSDWADISGNTFTVSKDSETTCQFRAVSASGKISNAGSVYDVKIDKAAPTIMNVTESTTGWTTGDVTLTVHAQDVGSGLYQYSFDGGQNWQDSPSYIYTANTTISAGTVRVRDIAGNTAIYSTDFVIGNIDKAAPTIMNMTESTTGWTTGDVTLTVHAQDVGSGLYQYSFDGGQNWQDSPSYIYTANTIISAGTVQVRDIAGNTAIYNTDFVIGNIDKAAPTIINMTESTTGWTTEDVTLTVHAQDVGSGLYQYSFDGGQNWQDSPSYIYTANTTISAGTVQVRDIAGNTAIYSTDFVIGNIDKAAPTIMNVTESTTGWTTGDVTLTVHAQDVGSGLYQYSFDGGQNWQDSPSYIYTANTTISAGTVQVRDIAGNTAIYNTDFVIGNIDKAAPTGMAIGFVRNPFKTVAHFLTFGLFFDDTVDVTFSASDSLSGIDHYEYQTVAEGGKLSDGGWESGSLSISPDFKGTVYARAVDKMGNVSGYVTKSLVVDKTAPVITLSSTSVVIVNKNAAIPVSVCDEGAGVGRISYQIGGGAEQTADLTTSDYSGLTKTYAFSIGNLPSGIYDVVIHAQDNAGHTVSATVQVNGASQTMRDDVTGVVANASGAVFPANVTTVFLRCSPVAQNTAAYAAISGLIGSDAEKSNLGALQTYSLELIGQDNRPTAFTGKVTVKIPILSGMSGDLRVYWYNDADGTVTDMNAKQENGYLVFETTHFSYYTIAELTSDAIPNPDTGNGSLPFAPIALLGISGCGLLVVSKGRRFRTKK